MAFAGNRRLPDGWAGLTVYTLVLMICAMALPPIVFEPGAREFIFVIGGIAIWRYLWGLTHFIRALIYQKIVFPRYRRMAELFENDLMPSKIYLLITSFRIESDTSIRVFRAAIQEAISCGVPVTIVASLVELADEFLIKEVFRNLNPPEHIRLHIVRIPGTGKRDGLAQGFKAISRDLPPEDAVVAVVDGDSVLEPGLIKRTSVFFRLMPDMGALTTDEECDVVGSKVIREWHSLRFAQRQMLMSSMGLSGRVLTLTGRMSMFRAAIITNPDFINQVHDDHVEHWRFGRLKFLTGDDKSSWYWVLKNGWKMLYVPDVRVHTVEHPPSDNFFKATTQLMFRWFGNMLRTNERALDVPPHVTGFFTWWCLLDQRISMWTSLSGPVFVAMMCFKYSAVFLPVYLVWIGFTRWIMTLMLLPARGETSWTYPFLLYYNQIYGSLIKTYVFFRLDRQSWTRQKTKLVSGQTGREQQINRFMSAALHTLSLLVFITLIGLLAGVFEV